MYIRYITRKWQTKTKTFKSRWLFDVDEKKGEGKYAQLVKQLSLDLRIF